MAKLEKFPFFKTLKVDADLVSNVWWYKRRFYQWGGSYKSLFWLQLCRKLKRLPPYKRKRAPTRDGRYSYSPAVRVQIVGDKEPLEIECKSNAEAERKYKIILKWVNEHKTQFECKFPADI